MFLLNLFILKNCQSSYVGDFTCTCDIIAIFGYNSVILLLGFTISVMLHRCTQAFLVQSFFNLIFKDNTIVVCSCPMSHALASSNSKTGGQYYSFTFV